MTKNNIFKRMRAGEQISPHDPEYPALYEAILCGTDIVERLNTSYHTLDQTRNVISQLTGRDIDQSVRIVPPFYTNFGQFIEFGKNIFINSGCKFMDEGGILIEDDVFIGPNVDLITQNHVEEPGLRNHTFARTVYIRQGAWIGAKSVILPGVTVGRNAIVGAGSVVTKNVPDNTVVAGNPARFIREIKQ